MKSIIKICMAVAFLISNVSSVKAQNDNTDLNAFEVKGFLKKDGKMLPLSDFLPDWENYKCNYKINFNSTEINIIDENKRVKHSYLIKNKNTKLTNKSIGQVTYDCHDFYNYPCTVTLKMSSSNPKIFAYLIVSQMTNKGIAVFLYSLKEF